MIAFQIFSLLFSTLALIVAIYNFRRKSSMPKVEKQTYDWVCSHEGCGYSVSTYSELYTNYFANNHLASHVVEEWSKKKMTPEEAKEVFEQNRRAFEAEAWIVPRVESCDNDIDMDQTRIFCKHAWEFVTTGDARYRRCVFCKHEAPDSVEVTIEYNKDFIDKMYPDPPVVEHKHSDFSFFSAYNIDLNIQQVAVKCGTCHLVEELGPVELSALAACGSHIWDDAKSEVLGEYEVCRNCGIPKMFWENQFNGS